MSQAGILHTSAIIDLARLDPSSLPEIPLITVITLAELSVGPLVAQNPSERADRQSVLQHVEAVFDPMPFDADAARAFGRVSASLRAAGRNAKARAFDAQIAAIALARDLPIYTANPNDFVGIDGIRVVAVQYADA